MEDPSSERDSPVRSSFQQDSERPQHDLICNGSLHGDMGQVLVSFVWRNAGARQILSDGSKNKSIGFSIVIVP